MSGFIKIEIEVPAVIGVQSRGESFNVSMESLPETIVAQLLEYGVVQKYADTVSDGKDMQEKWSALDERMRVGEWRGKRAGGSVDEHAAYRKELNESLNAIIKQMDAKARANNETREKVWKQLPETTRIKLAAKAKARMEAEKAERDSIMEGLEIEL